MLRAAKRKGRECDNNVEEPVNVDNTDPGSTEEDDTNEQATPIESLTIVTDVWEAHGHVLDWTLGSMARNPSPQTVSLPWQMMAERCRISLRNQVWSEDGLTWTLTFPEGMYYSTGEQLEPEDVVASIEHGLEYSTWADGYKTIESMERRAKCHYTPSEYQADMEYNFMSSFVGVIDKDELDTMSNDELLWGCHPYGAYYVEEFSGAYVTLKANPGYVTHNPLVENKGKMPAWKHLTSSWAVKISPIILA